MLTARILAGDCLGRLRELPAGSVHCCVTSPPYYGLRDYGTATWEGGDAGCGHVEQVTGASERNTLGPNGNLPQSNAAAVAKVMQYRRCPDAPPVPCTVLDPFGGAGTTALAAANLGRDSIVCELNRDYCEMARRRVSDAVGLVCQVAIE